MWQVPLQTLNTWIAYHITSVSDQAYKIYRYQTACYQDNVLIPLDFRALYSSLNQTKTTHLPRKFGSILSLETERKLHNRSRAEKIGQAAVSLAVSTAEVTTTALGKGGRVGHFWALLTSPGRFWKKAKIHSWHGRIGFYLHKKIYVCTSISSSQLH